MLAHFRRRSKRVGRLHGAGIVIALLVAAVGAPACDKLPLLAPSGTVITLFAASNVLPINNSVEIIATVIEQGTAPASGQQQQATAGAGTPVHNGTLVTFTTTLGVVEPREARTHNGQVTVRLIADGRSGVATVIAFSGGARSAELSINVGAAAVERIILTADPQSLGPSGGTTQITARVEDTNGNGLGFVPVTFSATSGTLQPPTATTDEFGLARTSLTTTRESDVSASAGSKTSTAPLKITVAARTGITLSPPSTAPTAGQPAIFTASVSATANVRDVLIVWGDGSTTSLGALGGSTTVSHVYGSPGTYVVSATATDVAGNSETVSTTVTIVPAAPIGVTITYSPASVQREVVVTFTAVVTPATTQIVRYEWTFGDGSGAITTGNQTSKSYGTTGTKVVRVTVVDVTGRTGFAQIEIEVR